MVALFERPGILAELAIYVGLGLLWALPFRFVFRGVARPDPDTARGRDARRRRPMLKTTLAAAAALAAGAARPRPRRSAR